MCVASYSRLSRSPGVNLRVFVTFLIWHEEIVKDEKSIWDNINTDLVLTGYNHCYGNKTLPLDFLFLCLVCIYLSLGNFSDLFKPYVHVECRDYFCVQAFYKTKISIS